MARSPRDLLKQQQLVMAYLRAYVGDDDAAGYGLVQPRFEVRVSRGGPQDARFTEWLVGRYSRGDGTAPLHVFIETPRALTLLLPEDRVAVLTHIPPRHEGFGCQPCADALGCSRKTLHERVDRGLTTLCTLLWDDEWQPLSPPSQITDRPHSRQEGRRGPLGQELVG